MYSSIGQKPLETCISWSSRSKVVCTATEVPGNGYFGLERRKQGRLYYVLKMCCDVVVIDVMQKPIRVRVSYRKEENTFQKPNLLSFESLRPPSSEADEEPSPGSSAAIKSLFPSVHGTELGAVLVDGKKIACPTADRGEEGSEFPELMEVLTTSRAAAWAAPTTGSFFDAGDGTEEGGTGRTPSDGATACSTTSTGLLEMIGWARVSSAEGWETSYSRCRPQQFVSPSLFQVDSLGEGEDVIWERRDVGYGSSGASLLSAVKSPRSGVTSVAHLFFWECMRQLEKGKSDVVRRGKRLRVFALDGGLGKGDRRWETFRRQGKRGVTQARVQNTRSRIVHGG
ncbi:hypothetical protein CPB85DRAFT_1259565 [Mucidula mucida]|nr:hypothetical protein CPB85DRAFT_1259565 [Mucidula mucida]